MPRELTPWVKIESTKNPKPFTMFVCRSKTEPLTFRLIKNPKNGVWTVAAKTPTTHGGGTVYASSFIKTEMRGEEVQVFRPATQLAMEFNPFNAEWFVRGWNC